MKTYKKALVDGHIGAIAVALLLFTGTSQFLQLLTSPLNNFYRNAAMSRQPQGMFQSRNPIPIFDPIATGLDLLEIALYFLTAILVVRWLYLDKPTEPAEATLDEELPE